MLCFVTDKTVKVWDLGAGEEVLTLDGHPNNVNHVKYCEYTQTVYTTCAYFMKVWDLREGNKCIRTITLVYHQAWAVCVHEGTACDGVYM